MLSYLTTQIGFIAAYLALRRRAVLSVLVDGAHLAEVRDPSVGERHAGFGRDRAKEAPRGAAAMERRPVLRFVKAGGFADEHDRGSAFGAFAGHVGPAHGAHTMRMPTCPQSP